ncbi:MAG: cytochrome B [Candidatus Marinimicrobia bacterium]|nr:cytochrome B [Candidatus Neomarinimicrobiota bacterium]|tara:strand:+ start:432 stop:1052 length:621 start_codon:yes stop_codon:yes gene_type:complete
MVNPIRSLYSWVLSLANSKNGEKSLAIISFTEAIFFPIPPDILLIPLCLGNRSKIFRFLTICSLLSIMGGAAGYFLGAKIWWNTTNEFSLTAQYFFKYIPGFTESIFYSIKTKYELYDFWIIFTAGFTPIPFKIFTISAGAFNVSFMMFLVASAISRSLRFLIISVLIYKFGKPVKELIDKYFNIVSVIFTILLIGGFLLIKLFAY